MIFRYLIFVLCTTHLKNCVGWQPSVCHWQTKLPVPSVALCTGMYSLSLQVCNSVFETKITTWQLCYIAASHGQGSLNHSGTNFWYICIRSISNIKLAMPYVSPVDCQNNNWIKQYVCLCYKCDKNLFCVRTFLEYIVAERSAVFITVSSYILLSNAYTCVCQHGGYHCSGVQELIKYVLIHVIVIIYILWHNLM